MIWFMVTSGTTDPSYLPNQLHGTHDTMNLPEIYRVSQKITAPDLPNPADVAREAVLLSRISHRLSPGARVAITAGSRGIANIAQILKAVVTAVRDLGFDPFIVAAMGSHGGATQQGQKELLSEFGITEENMNCRIHAELDQCLR